MHIVRLTSLLAALTAPIMSPPSADPTPSSTPEADKFLPNLEQQYVDAKWRYWFKHPETPQPTSPALAPPQ